MSSLPTDECIQPPETLKEFAAFCGENDLHLISDEIYAFLYLIIPKPQLPFYLGQFSVWIWRSFLIHVSFMCFIAQVRVFALMVCEWGLSVRGMRVLWDRCPVLGRCYRFFKSFTMFSDLFRFVRDIFLVAASFTGCVGCCVRRPALDGEFHAAEEAPDVRAVRDSDYISVSAWYTILRDVGSTCGIHFPCLKMT